MDKLSAEQRHANMAAIRSKDTKPEMMNPGGLYGQARPENFPYVNDYRNGVVAEMMKTLNYVNMFNHGVGEVQNLLRANNSPAAEFNVSYMTAFSVVVKEPDETSLPKLAQVNGKVNKVDNEKVVRELFQAFPNFGKVRAQAIESLLATCKTPISIKEIMSACNFTSRTSFDRLLFIPAKEYGLIQSNYFQNPHHPKQKYLLTEKGVAWLKKLEEADEGADHQAS